MMLCDLEFGDVCKMKNKTSMLRGEDTYTNLAHYGVSQAWTKTDTPVRAYCVFATNQTKPMRAFCVFLTNQVSGICAELGT